MFYLASNFLLLLFLFFIAIFRLPFSIFSTMTRTLHDILKDKVVILGIGNPLKGDDGFGPALVERLQGKITAVCLDAGTAPESYAGKIVKADPDTVLLVDAVHLDRAPGTWEILEKAEILKSGFTTHDISPRMFMDYLDNQIRADIYMLGVQPQTLALGGEMSEEVHKTLESLEKIILEVLRA